MINDPKYCDCKIDYHPDTDEWTGKSVENYYHGQGVWQCPECATIYDHSDKVYWVIMEYVETEDEGIKVNAILLDERLLVPPRENELSLVESFMEDFRDGGSWDYDGIEGHELGTFDIEIWWEYEKYHTDCGEEWDLEMKIINERKMDGC